MVDAVVEETLDASDLEVQLLNGKWEDRIIPDWVANTSVAYATDLISRFKTTHLLLLHYILLLLDS